MIMAPISLPRALCALCLLALVAMLSGGIAAQAEPAPQPAVAHQVFLPLMAKGGTAPTPLPNDPTSEELIARALQAGALDRETALRYHLLADFDDARLPAPYRGAASVRPSSAYHSALRAFAQLTPQTQALVREFSVPPSAAGSWEERRGSAAVAPAAANRWDTTCKTSPNIKVWYHPANEGDAEQARRICEIVDGTIWPRLTGLMGRKPLPDDAAPHTGGDARFDIYLVAARSSVMSANGSALSVPIERLCRATPSYMLVNRAGFTRSQLAELLMGAILNGYDADLCGEYAWLYAATRAWAPEYVYRADNAEHVHAPGYLRAAATPLDSASGDELELPSPGQPLFSDGAMLWPYYLRNILGRAELVAEIWSGSTGPNSLQVIDSVVPGGWAEQWPMFARMAWNRDIVNDYQKFDGLPHGLTPLRDEPIVLDGAPSRSIALDGAVKHLAIHTYRFTFPDADVRSFAVVNRYREADLKTAHVQALIKIGGVWTTEDWTATPLRPFCRDLRAERVEELVLLVSNHEFQNRSHTLRGEDGPLLSFTNLACRGWKAEVTITSSYTTSATQIDETTTTEATFERVRTPGIFSIKEEYRTTGGSASWEQSGYYGSCVGSGSGSYALADTGASGEADGRFHLSQYGLAIRQGALVFNGARDYLGVARASVADDWIVPYTCPGGNTIMRKPLHAGEWLVTDHGVLTQVAGDDGERIAGTHTLRRTVMDDIISTNTWRWVLTALPPE